MKKSVLAGKAINEEDIPPEVVVPSADKPRPHLAQSLVEDSAPSKPLSSPSSSGSENRARPTSVPHSVAFPAQQQTVSAPGEALMAYI